MNETGSETGPVRVLIADSLNPNARDRLVAAGGFTVDALPKITPEELVRAIGDYDALIVRSRTKANRQVLEAATRLKVIGRAGIGVDNIDVAEATRRGIIVMNAPHGNATTTAELAIAHVCALARKLPNATASMRKGRWEKKRFMGRELSKSVLGVVGLGNIGRIVAQRGLGLRMRVLGFDPFVSAEVMRKLSIEPADSLDDLLSRSDFLTIHTPLTEKTRHLIGAAELAKMKPGAYLVNCARGGIVDEHALYEALERGGIAGAALDVFETEPPGDHPLLTLDNVHASPHIGASTAEAQEQVAAELVDQIIDYFHRNLVRNALNLPRVQEAKQEVLWPYVELGRKLGGFAAQLHDGQVSRVEVDFHGDVFHKGDVALVTHSVLEGVLSCVLTTPVNVVSAPVTARERGIAVAETLHGDGSAFARLLGVRISGPGESHEVQGTCFGPGDARMVAIDGSRLEAIPEGILLLTRNDDVPGMIGRIGTLLGEEKVNVSRMQVSLPVSGREAIAIWSVDSPVPEPLIRKIRELDHIHACKQVVV